jgi:uncharacterized membrane protein YfcA
MQRKKISHGSQILHESVAIISAFPHSGGAIRKAMLDGLSLALIAAAAGFTFFAGLVKGVTGFAMPMIMISSLGSFLPPETALAGLILPTLLSNLWQAVRQGIGAALASARRHWRYLGIVLVFIAISAQFVTRLPGSTLFLILGIPVTVFALLQLAGWRPRVDPEKRLGAEIGVGIFAGTIGGLSGVWGPPTVIYLTAMDTPKTEHVRVQGVVYGAGAVVLTLSHLHSGVLNDDGLTFSTILIVPALLGMFAGFAVQDRLDQEKFRWAILIVLAIAGLNLVRRGLWG